MHTHLKSARLTGHHEVHVSLHALHLLLQALEEDSQLEAHALHGIAAPSKGGHGHMASQGAKLHASSKGAVSKHGPWGNVDSQASKAPPHSWHWGERLASMACSKGQLGRRHSCSSSSLTFCCPRVAWVFFQPALPFLSQGLAPALPGIP